MNRGQKLTVFIIVVIVLVGGVAIWKQTVSNIGQTYTNSVYGYTLSYPSDEKADYIAEYATIPVSQSGDIMIYKPPDVTEFGVTAYVPLDGVRTPEVTKAYGDLIVLPLQQFAESIRQDQVQDTNPYTPNKKVGALATTTFAGHPAYSFTLTNTFNGIGEGYVLDPHNESTIYNFVFVENDVGTKLMIRYPLNDDIAQQIANSFKFSQ